MKDTLIIGSNGYIGSAIFNKLKDQSVGLDVDNSDLTMDYGKIKKKELSKYKNIVLLAGSSSVKSCDGHIKYSFKNNVSNFIKLIGNLNVKQKLIYASSASIYGNTNGQIVDELYNNFTPISFYDLTKKIIDLYCQTSKIQYYGLRFGTVNGKTEYSNIVREDLIINAMTKSAILNGKISCINPDVNRGILGLNDLCNAIETIIKAKKNNSGIYNLASFNSSVRDISQHIANHFNCKIDIKNNTEDITYNFKLDTNKFCKNYNFEFKDSISSIIDQISIDFDKINFIRRDQCLKI